MGVRRGLMAMMTMTMMSSVNLLLVGQRPATRFGQRLLSLLPLLPLLSLSQLFGSLVFSAERFRIVVRCCCAGAAAVSRQCC